MFNLFRAFFVTTLLSGGTLAHAAQISCQSSSHGDSFRLLISNVPNSYLANSQEANLQVKNASLQISAGIAMTGSLEDSTANGGIGAEGGEILIAVRSNQSRFLVTIRAQPWNQAGVTKGFVENGTIPQRLPVTCFFSR